MCNIVTCLKLHEFYYFLLFSFFAIPLFLGSFLLCECNYSNLLDKWCQHSSNRFGRKKIIFYQQNVKMQKFNRGQCLNIINSMPNIVICIIFHFRKNDLFTISGIEKVILKNWMRSSFPNNSTIFQKLVFIDITDC